MQYEYSEIIIILNLKEKLKTVMVLKIDKVFQA
jgi:hypothetical protein